MSEEYQNKILESDFVVNMDVEVGEVFSFREQKVDTNEFTNCYLNDHKTLHNEYIETLRDNSAADPVHQPETVEERPEEVSPSTSSFNNHEETSGTTTIPKQKPSSKKSFDPEKFDMERIVKNCINSCINYKKTDPRVYHWVVYRCLEILKFTSRHFTENTELQIWRKFDAIATKAFEDNQKLIVENPNHPNSKLLYENVDELPDPTLHFTSKNTELTNRTSYFTKTCLRELESLLLRNVREFVLKYATESSNPILEEIEIRREFLLSYVKNEIPEGIRDQNIDQFWKTLVTQTRESYLISMNNTANHKSSSFNSTNGCNMLSENMDLLTPPNITDPVPVSNLTSSPKSSFSSSPVSTESICVSSAANEAFSSRTASTPENLVMALMASESTEGELVLELNDIRQIESFVQFMSTMTNKVTVKVQLKNELLDEGQDLP